MLGRSNRQRPRWRTARDRRLGRDLRGDESAHGLVALTWLRTRSGQMSPTSVSGSPSSLSAPQARSRGRRCPPRPGRATTPSASPGEALGKAQACRVDHDSVICPPATRWMKMPDTLACRPVAGMPWKVPRWVPVAVQRVTARSDSGDLVLEGHPQVRNAVRYSLNSSIMWARPTSIPSEPWSAWSAATDVSIQETSPRFHMASSTPRTMAALDVVSHHLLPYYRHGHVAILAQRRRGNIHQLVDVHRSRSVDPVNMREDARVRDPPRRARSGLRAPNGLDAAIATGGTSRPGPPSGEDAPFRRVDDGLSVVPGTPTSARQVAVPGWHLRRTGR